MDIEQDFEAVLAAWPLERPYQLRPTRIGRSRLTRYVDTAGGSFILSVYPADTTAARVHYEHALLNALLRSELPYAVPEPLRAWSGDTVAMTPDGRAAAVYNVIPGYERERTKLDHVHTLGVTLGQLHLAFATVDLGPAPAGHRVYGAMDRLLSGQDEPGGELDDCPLAQSARAGVETILADLRRTAPAVVTGLPHQLRHGDFHSGNSLFDGDRLTGILDFEVAGYGARAMDLAHGSYYLSVYPPEDPWPRVAAFAAGYRSVLRPTGGEVAAVPLLLRLYFGASVPLLVARWRAGDATDERVRTRADQLLTLDAFLSKHGSQLTDLLAAG